MVLHHLVSVQEAWDTFVVGVAGGMDLILIIGRRQEIRGVLKLMCHAMRNEIGRREGMGL